MSKKSKETYSVLFLIIVVIALVLLLLKFDIIKIDFNKTDYVLPGIEKTFEQLSP